MVELLTGVVFASLFITVSPSDVLSSIYYLISTTIFCIYVVIFFYDIRYKIIPDPLVYSAIFLSFSYRIFAHYLLPETSYLDLFAGPIIFSFFGLIWLLSRGRAMGFGDAKLGLSVGLLLGAANGFSAIILSFWIGALVSLSIIALGKLGFLNKAKGLTMKSEVPFAPFIILGAWLGLIFSLDILHATLL
jgi:leader peptidase (prepilin peptidase)/N-methyltransferase